MNKEELIAKLKDCYTDDTETGHVRADKALLEYINDQEITKLFNDMDKWYA